MRSRWRATRAQRVARVAVAGVAAVGLLLLQMGSPAEAVSGGDPAVPPGVIGVSLHVGAERVGDPAVLYIAMVHPEGPAQKAGLSHGDEVTAVDGQAVTGKTYEQVALMIRGDVGSKVTLSIKGESGAKEVSVPRVAGDSLYKGGMPAHGGTTR